MSWTSDYPHVIIASMILKNGKIHDWKIGECSLSQKYNIFGLIKEHNNYSYLEKSFIAYSEYDHNKIFEHDAIEFMKPFEVDNGINSPFKESINNMQIDLDKVFGGRFKIISPIKYGSE